MDTTESQPQPRAGRGYILSLFSYAHFAEHLSSALLVPLLPFIRDQFGLTYFQAGLLVSGFSISAGLANLPMGWLGDRLGIRRVFAMGIGGVVLGGVAIGLSTGFYQILVFAVLAGLFSGAYHPLSAAFLGSFYGIQRRGRVLGVHMVGGSVGVMAAPVLGGLLAEHLSWRYAFILMTLPALPLVFLFLRLHRSPETEEATRPKVAVEAAPAPDPTLSQMIRPIALIISLSLAVQMIAMALTSMLPVYLVDRRGVSAGAAAMLLGLLRGGGIVGAPLGGFICDRIGRKPGILTSIVAVGPLLLLAVITPMGAGLIAFLLLLGIATQMRQPAAQSLLIEAVPSGRQSTLLGIYFFFAAEGRSIMVPLVGFLMDTAGLGQTFLILSSVAVAFSVASLLLRKRV